MTSATADTTPQEKKSHRIKKNVTWQKLSNLGLDKCLTQLLSVEGRLCVSSTPSEGYRLSGSDPSGPLLHSHTQNILKVCEEEGLKVDLNSW